MEHVWYIKDGENKTIPPEYDKKTTYCILCSSPYGSRKKCTGVPDTSKPE